MLLSACCAVIVAPAGTPAAIPVRTIDFSGLGDDVLRRGRRNRRKGLFLAMASGAKGGAVHTLAKSDFPTLILIKSIRVLVTFVAG